MKEEESYRHFLQDIVLLTRAACLKILLSGRSAGVCLRIFVSPVPRMTKYLGLWNAHNNESINDGQPSILSKAYTRTFVHLQKCKFVVSRNIKDIFCEGKPNQHFFFDGFAAVYALVTGKTNANFQLFLDAITIASALIWA